jgi:riboflavin synthase
MFTGIVEELGEVVSVEQLAEAARLTVRGPRVTADVTHGDSIAVNGVCLTVTAATGTAFSADVMAETLSRSALGALESGSQVNLERSLRVGDRLGGHMVQGHVDGVARVMSRVTGEHWDVVRIAVPAGLGRYLVEKGSVAVDGISLTVSALGSSPGGASPGERSPGAPRQPGLSGSAEQPRPGEEPWFEVSLIPATLATTTLGRVQPGGSVNLEVDVIGKYVERMLRAEPEMARP